MNKSKLVHMKTIIIYASIHHGNTEKIAKEIGSVLGAEVLKFSEVSQEDIEKADLVGFGSGIYFAKFHKALTSLTKGLPDMEGKSAFFFSTSGMKGNGLLNRSHDKFRRTLKERGFEVGGDFNCPGYDTYSVLKLAGGIHKGRPDQRDLEKAREFAESIKAEIG
ncbi:MAG: flavodoxin family protein [Patescibacteria group bacterium]